MRACRELTQYGLMTAMDAIKDANRQPSVLKRNVGEGTIMLHWITQGHRATLPQINSLCLYSASPLASLVKKTFLGCHSAEPSSPVAGTIRAINSPAALTPRTNSGWAAPEETYFTR